nr:hypothetical protein [uncultured Roseateles sp.]
MVRSIRLFGPLGVFLALVAASHAAPPSPLPPAASQPGNEMPMADYLGLLAQIAPAAREGAEAYLQAFQQRCGRPLTAAELRRAMSEGDGDPVLMGMIRASQLRDPKVAADLGQRLNCRSAR